VSERTLRDRVLETERIRVENVQSKSAHCEASDINALDVIHCDIDGKHIDDSVVDMEEADDVSCVWCIDELDEMLGGEDQCDSVEWEQLLHRSSSAESKSTDFIDRHKNLTDIPISFQRSIKLSKTDDTIDLSSPTQMEVIGSNKDICQHSTVLCTEVEGVATDTKDENKDKSAHDEYQEGGGENRSFRCNIVDDRNKGMAESSLNGHYQKQTNLRCVSRSSQTDWKHLAMQTVSSDLAERMDHECESVSSLLPSYSLVLAQKTDVNQIQLDCTNFVLSILDSSHVQTSNTAYHDSFRCIVSDAKQHTERCKSDMLFNKSLTAEINDKFVCTPLNYHEFFEPCNITEQFIENNNVQTGKCSFEKEAVVHAKTETQINNPTNILMEGTVVDATRVDDALLLHNTILQVTEAVVPGAAVQASRNNNKQTGSVDETTSHHPRPPPLTTHFSPPPTQSLPPNPPTTPCTNTDLRLLLNSSTTVTALNSCYHGFTLDTGSTPGCIGVVSVTQSSSVTAATDPVAVLTDVDAPQCLQLPAQSTTDGDLQEKAHPQAHSTSVILDKINKFTQSTFPNSLSAINSLSSTLCNQFQQSATTPSTVNIPANAVNNFTLNGTNFKHIIPKVMCLGDVDMTVIAASLLSLQQELDNTTHLLSRLQQFSGTDSEQILSRVFSVTTEALRFIKTCSVRENNQHNKAHQIIGSSENRVNFQLWNITDIEACQIKTGTVRNTMRDVETSTLVTSVTCGTNTARVFHVDVGVETRPVTTVDSATSMPRPPSLIDKETCTPTVHHIHKNVATHNEPMVDKHTEMSVDVTAAYRMETLLSWLVCLMVRCIAFGFIGLAYCFTKISIQSILLTNPVCLTDLTCAS